MSERGHVRRGPVGRIVAVVAGAVVGMSVAGCGGGQAADPSAGTSGTSAPSTSTATPAATGVEVGERVEAPIGEEPGAVLSLVVESVTVVAMCPGRVRPLEEPAFAAFVVLDLTAQVTWDGIGTPPPDAVVPLGADAFRIIAPDGTVQEVTSTDASWACYDDAELAPPFVGPDETAAGTVVLDSATEHGTVVFAPGGEPGWAWTF